MHSHIKHLEAFLEAAKMAGVEKSFVHFFSDGRDTSPVGGGKCASILLYGAWVLVEHRYLIGRGPVVERSTISMLLYYAWQERAFSNYLMETSLMNEMRHHFKRIYHVDVE